MFLNLTSTPKIATKGPKRAKKAPNLVEVEVKANCTFKTKNVYEPDPNSKNSPKEPKNSPKEPQKNSSN